MPTSLSPPTAAVPGCVEARRRHQGRSNGSHVHCPASAACRTSPSRGSQGSDPVGPPRSSPPTTAAPGCMEVRRRHRGRSTGSHVHCPASAACRTTSSHTSQGTHPVWPLSSRPPPLGSPLEPPLQPSIRQALSRLYDQLKGSDKILSAADLLFFMEEEQQESSKSCRKQIAAGGTYSFLEFCDFWYKHASQSKRPLDLGKVDFSKPISNYYINSSHNTYIGEGDQVSGVISTEQYRKVSRTPKPMCSMYGAHSRLTNTGVSRSSEADAGV